MHFFDFLAFWIPDELLMKSKSEENELMASLITNTDWANVSRLKII